MAPTRRRAAPATRSRLAVASARDRQHRRHWGHTEPATASEFTGDELLARPELQRRYLGVGAAVEDEIGSDSNENENDR